MTDAVHYCRRLQSDFGFVYTDTLVHGSFRKSALSALRKDALMKQNTIHTVKRVRHSILGGFTTAFRETVVKRVGEDWIFLTLLGLSMSIISFTVDLVAQILRNLIVRTYISISHIYARYFVWTCLPLSLVLFSALIVQFFAPQAAGSGLPEIKTMMRGVVLPGYLTFRTAAVKTIALTAALGSGVPIGKMGPFVHTCCAIGVVIGNFLSEEVADVSIMTFMYNDMLAAACAVGVAATFNAPIGGVLFSIEVTSSYFAIHNYWRGFYASLLGALFFRLFNLARDHTSTLLPVQFLHFNTAYPFAPIEIVAFAILGIYCGIFAALFTVLHKFIVLFERKLKLDVSIKIRKILYAAVVSLIIFSTTFPHSIGKFMGKEHSINMKLRHLLSFGIWNGDLAQEWTQIQEIWSHNRTFSYLAIFFSANFLLTVLASTLPIPLGLYAPLFLLGGTFGRLFGELMAIIFPEGIHYPNSETSRPIIPAGYALAGAAALSGAATHTISIAVIAVEMTGEILYLLPIMVTVVIANIVSRGLHISVYDTIIRLKNLPYMPDIHSNDFMYFKVKAEDFMNTDFQVIDSNTTYAEAEGILTDDTRQVYPFVDDRRTLILYGLIQRHNLEKFLADRRERRRKISSSSNMGTEKRKISTSSNLGPESTGRYSVIQTDDFDDQKDVVNFEKIVEAVPYQIAKHVALYDVYTVFMLLGINVTCVTSQGRIIGTVSDKEIRDAVSKCGLLRETKKRSLIKPLLHD